MPQRKAATIGGPSQAHDLGFKLCPRCGRAIPASSEEAFCINDGVRLLKTCPQCDTRILHPYAKHCSNCGTAFSLGKAQSD
jgi:formate dehydrogenase maturation protein FdhE